MSGDFTPVETQVRAAQKSVGRAGILSESSPIRKLDGFAVKLTENAHAADACGRELSNQRNADSTLMLG